VSAEVACITSYLQLEELRHPDRIRSHLHIDPRCAGHLVPTLILLPLVENAVKYGLRSRQPRVLVDVQARITNGLLELTVRNPCRTDPPPQPQRDDGGRGLRLVRDRLAMHFGDHASLDAGSSPPGEYQVRVRMPLRDYEHVIIQEAACSEL
jgi:LytS/YehU family sensor histidine kinase